ncbi:HD-GYP domain-containing protein [Kosmotoga pacifica]|uniref:HD-GYP domain-containing protein n=1 Tax=Kosmotoga pacifica TaxID=1330330 RepID=UPI0006998C88|nr:HD-GYP domain-containing protein [Kosmotoga pacifica]
MRSEVEDFLLNASLNTFDIDSFKKLYSISSKKEREYLDSFKLLASDRSEFSEEELEGLRKLAAFIAKRGKVLKAYNIAKKIISLINVNSTQSLRFKLFYMMLCYELGKKEEAMEYARELLNEKHIPEELKSTYYNALGLVATYYPIGIDPVSTLRKAMNYNDNTGKLLAPYNLAEYFYHKGNFEESLRIVREIKLLASGYAKSMCLIMELKCLLVLNKIEEAERISRKLEQLNSEMPQRIDIGTSYVFLGHFYNKIGNSARAHDYLDKVYQLLQYEYTPYLYGEASALKAEILSSEDEHFKAIEAIIDAFQILRKERFLSPHIMKCLRSVLSELLEVFSKLIATLRKKDDYTASHTLRVSYFAYLLAKQMRYTTLQLFDLIVGAMLHDYGKVKIPDEILNKPGKLTDEEMNIIRLHPQYGMEFLQGLNFPDIVLHIVYMHHERIDGRGYPQGLKNGEIPEVAQIAAIADVFDALTTDRPYRKALTKREAIDFLISTKGKLANEELMDNFMNVLEQLKPRNYSTAFREIWKKTVDDLLTGNTEG